MSFIAGSLVYCAEIMYRSQIVYGYGVYTIYGVDAVISTTYSSYIKQLCRNQNMHIDLKLVSLVTEFVTT